MIRRLLRTQYAKHRDTSVNFFWRSIQILSQQGITFLIFLLSSKFLSPYDFGIYNYILSIALFLILFSDFGVSTATSKYVAAYDYADKEKLRGILFNTTVLIALTTLLITALTLLFGPGYLQEKYAYMLLLLPIVFLAPMTSLYDGIYRGLKKFKLLAYVSAAAGFVSIWFVYFLVARFGLWGALIAQDLFYLVLLISLAIGYRDFSLRFNAAIVREIGSYSFFYGLAVVGNYLFIRFGVLILGHYNYIEQIATYELINRILLIVVLPFTLLGQVVAPNFAVFAARKDYAAIYTKAVRYTIIFIAAGIVLAAALYVLIPIVFSFIFAAYVAKPYFHITLLCCLAAFAANIWSATFDAGILIPSGYAGLMARVYFVGGVIGVLLSLYLVHILGYVGVIVSFAVCNVLFVVTLRSLFLVTLARQTYK